MGYLYLYKGLFASKSIIKIDKQKAASAAALVWTIVERLGGFFLENWQTSSLVLYDLHVFWKSI